MLKETLTYLFLHRVSPIVATFATGHRFLEKVIELNKVADDKMASRHGQLGAYRLAL